MLNRESVPAVLFTDWDEALKHGPGAIIWTGDVGKRSLIMIVPGDKDFRSIAVVEGPQDGEAWGWDGNVEAPTLTPSIDAIELGPAGQRLGSTWHGYLRAGRFESC